VAPDPGACHHPRRKLPSLALIRSPPNGALIEGRMLSSARRRRPSATNCGISTPRLQRARANLHSREKFRSHRASRRHPQSREVITNHKRPNYAPLNLAEPQAVCQREGRGPRYTMTKVGKSDCEGTFDKAFGNDEVAPIADRGGLKRGRQQATPCRHSAPPIESRQFRNSK